MLVSTSDPLSALLLALAADAQLPMTKKTIPSLSGLILPSMLNGSCSSIDNAALSQPHSSSEKAKICTPQKDPRTIAVFDRNAYTGINGHYNHFFKIPKK